MSLTDESLVNWAADWVANERERERFTKAFREELSRRRAEQIKARVESIDVRHGKVTLWLNTHQEGMRYAAKRLLENPDLEVIVTPCAVPAGSEADR